MSQDPFVVDYFLFCEDTIVDANKRLTIVNLFDIVNASEFPASNYRFKAVFRLKPKEDKALRNIKVSFKITVSNNAEEIAKSEGTASEISISKGSALASTADLSGIVFPKAGEYKAQFYVNGKLLAERPLKVVLVK